MQMAPIVGVALLAAALGATAAVPYRQAISPGAIAAPADTVIPCDQSPFGKTAPIVKDLEPMLQLLGSGGQFFDEYRPSLGAETPPLQRVYRANLTYALPMWKSVSVDLNGDGRDEVVTAFSNGSSVFLAVYSRADGPTALVIDTWTYSSELLQADSIDMVAGDLDGSNDKQQEIALSWIIGSGPNSGKVRVVVLKGDGAGHIVQADNATAGNYVSPNPGLSFPRLAVGDFLLAGREQVVLAAYAGAAAGLVYHLIELDDGSNPSSLTTVLPSAGTAMRADYYVTFVGATSPDPGAHFYVDDATAIAMQSNGIGGGVIEAMDADGGDVTDTAAAELVVHVMFPEPVSPVSHVLAARVMHFVTTRNASNVIQTIALGGDEHGDSSMMLERYTGQVGGPNAPPKFAATVADVDGIALKEIITARVGHDGSDGFSLGPVVWLAHKVHVRLESGFQYENRGLDVGQPLVAFINRSHGEIKSYDWDFGDNTHSAESNPLHRFNTTGDHTVTLTVTAYDNTQQVSGQVITVSTTPDSQPQGLLPPALTYKIDPAAAFTGTTVDEYPTFSSDHTAIRLAVGDMNHDGLPEVVVAVNNDGKGVDTHVFHRQSTVAFGLATRVENPLAISYMELVLSDFDGDSLNAVLSNTTGDCRLTRDLSIHSLTWMPPYFADLQANANRSARYGETASSGSSTEERSSSYFSHNVTGWIGVGGEINEPITAIKTLELEAKVTFGYNYQTETGELHGDEYEYSVDSGFSLDDDTQSIGQEGLVATVKNTANCYTYTLVQSGDPVSGTMRACETGVEVPTQDGSGAVDWNRLATVQAPKSIPYDWIPVERDWASLALFRVPNAGSGAGGITFIDAAHGKDKATDGMFDTAAVSVDDVDRPYLDIDLGTMRDITAIRVFPAADPKSSPTAFEHIEFKAAAKDLLGFRLYASATPFSGNDLPTAATSTAFVPGGISTFVQDTGVEAIYRIWNVWTGNPGTSSNDPNAGQPLRAHFLRLQKPTSGKINIAEIQVFGNFHTEPQFFPEQVCDDRVGDGLFKAYVYDGLHNLSRVIQVRGDMMWTGAAVYSNNVLQPTGVPGCAFDDSTDGNGDAASPDTVREEEIWAQTAVGGVSADWSLSQNHTHTDGKDESIDGAAHVGAEFEAKAGSGVLGIVGAAYEFSWGVTHENQSSLTTGSGFTVSGVMGGFDDQQFHDLCLYYPRPYAFKLTDYSNTGFRHDMYVTDYVVHQSLHADAWQHSAVPIKCSSFDRIFANDFE